MSNPIQRRRIRGTLALCAVLVLVMAAAALGLAGALKLSGSANAGLGRTIVVNPAGRTLYTLSGETSRHLLCRAGCLRVWPPVTVTSRSERIVLAAGAHGSVTLLRRPGGALQVLLRGKPLYRYSGDSAKGETNGEGIKADGGTWHALSAAAAPEPAASKSPAAPYTY